MGNNRMIVAERSRDLGQFMVGRLLPFRRKRQVGPFTFIDHMGPSVIGPGQYMDVKDTSTQHIQEYRKIEYRRHIDSFVS